MNFKKVLPPFAAVVLLAGVAWGVYGRTFSAPFIFDDSESISRNDSIKNLSPLIGDLQNPGPLNPGRNNTTSGRPLVNLSLALNYHWGGLNPWGYHAFNLVVHLLSALLLLAIVRRTLRLAYFEGRFNRASDGLALAVALVWAVHPLQTETVVYVTQRTELIVGFFYLATLYSSLRYWAADSASVRNTWLALATLACLAGMASKEVMVTSPVIVLLFDRTFVSGSFWQSLRKSWPLYVGLFLGWGLLLWLNYSAPRSESAGFNLGIVKSAWWFTQTKVLLLYLKLAVWPWPLSIHYEMPYLTTFDDAWPWAIPVAGLLIGVLILCWRGSAMGFVGAWTLLILSPTLVVPIITEVAAERRMYLPLALIGLVVVGGYGLLERKSRQPASRAAKRKTVPRWPDIVTASFTILVALVFSAISVKRLAAYHDDLTLWQDTVLQQPDDYLAHNNLGKALSELGQFPAAIAQYEQSIQLNPDYFPARNNLGATLNECGRWPEAIPQLELALRLKPFSAEAHNNLGVALAAVNRPQEAIEEYRKALQLQREYSDARFNLSLALRAVGKPAESVEQCLKALQLTPNSPKAWANLAMAYSELDRRQDAIAAAEQSLKLARAQGQTTLATKLAEWLNFYRAQTASAPSGTNGPSSLSPAP